MAVQSCFIITWQLLVIPLLGIDTCFHADERWKKRKEGDTRAERDVHLQRLFTYASSASQTEEFAGITAGKNHLATKWKCMSTVFGVVSLPTHDLYSVKVFGKCFVHLPSFCQVVLHLCTLQHNMMHCSSSSARILAQTTLSMLLIVCCLLSQFTILWRWASYKLHFWILMTCMWANDRSVCLSLCLSVCPSACLPAWPSSRLSIHLFACPCAGKSYISVIKIVWIFPVALGYDKKISSD